MPLSKLTCMPNRAPASFHVGFGNGISPHGFPGSWQEEIQKMISDVDDDGSGTIGYEERLGKTCNPKYCNSWLRGFFT